jgi:hypothetical protein
MNRIFLLLLFSATVAQSQSLTLPTPGGSPKATVGEQIGLTDVNIVYGRPAVNGRAGKVWGQLVHFGFKELDYGTSKAAPWRAGANEGTVFSTSTNLNVEGKTLPEGQYGLFMAVYADSVSVIFSRNNTAWGSYFYEPAADALRVTVRPRKNQPLTERLTYSFDKLNDSLTTLSLHWENWQIPIRLGVNLKETIMASLRRELVSGKSELHQNWVQAVNYALTNNIVNEEILGWAEQAIIMPYMGQRNFLTLSTKAQVLNRLGRQPEADSLMREALPLGTMLEVHQYGRQLLNQKRTFEALTVFQKNAQRNPNVFTTNMGLARGYAATGDTKQALKYAKAALLQAPDSPNRESVSQFIEKLSAEAKGK